MFTWRATTPSRHCTMHSHVQVREEAGQGVLLVGPKRRHACRHWPTTGGGGQGLGPAQDRSPDDPLRSTGRTKWPGKLIPTAFPSSLLHHNSQAAYTRYGIRVTCPQVPVHPRAGQAARPGGHVGRGEPSAVEVRPPGLSVRLSDCAALCRAQSNAWELRGVPAGKALE